MDEKTKELYQRNFYGLNKWGYPKSRIYDQMVGYNDALRNAGIISWDEWRRVFEDLEKWKEE